jgi:hypothetical protein
MKFYDRDIVIGDIKRNEKRIDLQALKDTAQNIVRSHQRYKIDFTALSLYDM